MRETDPMVPIGSPDENEVQSEAERLEIARRYRRHRTAELRELARRVLEREPVAAGEFSTVPIESLAAIPVIGAIFAGAIRIGRSRKRFGPNLMLALDDSELHLISLRSEVTGPRPILKRSMPRDSVRVSEVRPRFMREQVTLEIEGEDPLRLYARSLKTNPWSAEVVRLLGGEAPEPIDLSGTEVPDLAGSAAAGGATDGGATGGTATGGGAIGGAAEIEETG